MKTNFLTACMAFVALPALGPELRAANGAGRVLFKDGQVWVLQAGQVALLENNLELPNHITVSTNGTFKVGAYAPRPFAEGQILGTDGMLLSTNGQIEPVIDHVALDAGKTISSMDG